MGAASRTLSETRFRPEIQGLRAAAILGVVGYHAFPEALPGGFAGVDVFFVISGFLITRILVRDIAAGRYSLPAFYARRVARLFPALIVVLAATTGLSLTVLPPDRLGDYFDSLAASSFFLANFHFGREVDYFAQAADLEPLLHTWSLAIEEQFYIFYPLVLAGLIRFVPRARQTALLIFGLLSLGIAITPDVLPIGGVLPFYSPLTRGYELLIGCLLALGEKSPPNQRRAATEVVIGAALIAASFVLFGAGQQMPGWRALVPCLGCALIIRASAAAPARLISPLTSRPAQFFGDISYSLYLWHWPVLVFGRFVTMGAPGPVGLTLCIVVSVVLATLSYRFIERPVLARHWRPRWALGSALAVVVMATLPSLTGVAQHGLPNRFAPPALDLLADKADFSPLRARCHADFARPATYADRCVLGAATLPDTLLWSDSIGVELAYALEPHFRRASRSVRQATASSCPPVLVGTGFGPACLSFNRDVLWSLAKDRAIQWVVLDAHYLGYQEIGHTGTSGTEIADRLVETALHLDRIGKKVVILLPLPSYSIPVPDGLGVAAHLGLSLERQGQSRRAFERARSEVVQRLETASRRGNIRLVDPAGAFCNQSRCRASSHTGRALYFDRYHPSVTGAAQVVNHGALPAALGLDAGPLPQTVSKPRQPARPGP